MKKLGPMIAMVATLAPAAAFAAPSTTVAANAAKQCSVLRTQLGTSAFGKNFATFGVCVAQLTPLARENLAAARAACRGSSTFARCVVTYESASLKAAKTAAASCRAEQGDTGFAADHGGKTFAQYYGTNATRANAFGRCVSEKATLVSSGVTPAPQQPTVSPTPPGGTPPTVAGGECGTKTGPPGIPKPMISNDCTFAGPA